MRYIDLSQLRLLAVHEEFAALENAQREIEALSDEKARSDYIDANTSLWSNLRFQLWYLGGFKCWYSERKLEANLGEVEHFRPKKQVWKTIPRHGGYWWRAFDWRNFRLAHPIVNKRMKDYSSGKLNGKGCYFPLKDETKRGHNIVTEASEEPVLLDPTVAEDCHLICFDGNSGKPIPFYSVEQDEWRHQRASKSIEIYHLDEGTWNAARADLMRDVAILCDKIKAAKSSGDLNEYDELYGEIAQYLSPFYEFSSAVHQVYTEKIGSFIS